VPFIQYESTLIIGQWVLLIMVKSCGFGLVPIGNMEKYFKNYNLTLRLSRPTAAAEKGPDSIDRSFFTDHSPNIRLQATQCRGPAPQQLSILGSPEIYRVGHEAALGFACPITL